jgi:hypothetical protein
MAQTSRQWLPMIEKQLPRKCSQFHKKSTLRELSNYNPHMFNLNHWFNILIGCVKADTIGYHQKKKKAAMKAHQF